MIITCLFYSEEHIHNYLTSTLINYFYISNCQKYAILIMQSQPGYYMLSLIRNSKSINFQIMNLMHEIFGKRGRAK